MKLSALLERFGLSTHGDLKADVELTGVRPLDQAGPGELSFLSNPKYKQQVRTTGAAAVLIKEPLEGCEAVQILCKDPYVTLAHVLQALYPEPVRPGGVHPLAYIHPEADVSPEAWIGPHCTVEADASIGPGTELVASVYIGEGVVIGEDGKIFPNVTLYDRVTVGDRVRIHAGSSIGSDGYGYAQDRGVHVKVPQIGGVIIEDDVEIGANTAIDRGSLGDTVIGQGSKIDNLVQIAHNVVIGKGALLVSQTGLSGSSKIGNYAVLAGKVGVVGHVRIGDQVWVLGQSVVTKDLDKAGRYAGNPAVPHIQYQRQMARIRSLPDLARRVKALEKMFEQGDPHGERS